MTLSLPSAVRRMEGHRKAIPLKSTQVQGYDATSHFETTVEDVLEMYTRITGKVLDLDKKSTNLSQE